MNSRKSLKENWEFNVLNIYNYHEDGMFSPLFKYLEENHDSVDGDLIEAGVHKGRSLLSVALWLKERGSQKKVYGFDSFAGFPPIYDAKDDLGRFEVRLAEGIITKPHFEKIKKNLEYRELALGKAVDSKNISLSGDFSGTSILKDLKKKMEYLELDNIELVEGPFSQTMKGNQGPGQIMLALLDCDLYKSYQDCLPYVWERLSKGGYIWLDEHYSLKFPGAREAANEFFKDKGDQPEMHNLKPRDFERWFVRKS